MSDLPHILLVEDSGDSASALSRLLKREGFCVTIAGTLGDAMSLFTRHRFDVLISDLKLPDGSGLDFMCWVRERRAVPGIAITGSDDVAASRAAGFAGHFTKPLHFDRLVASVRGLVSAGTASPG